jgi:hypothetical protein
MAPSYNPSYKEVEIGRWWFEASQAKDRERLFHQQVVMAAHICDPSYSGSGGRRISVRGLPRQRHEILSEK